MADALCGPSNPLQSFKNHSQIDRTLQQDRIAGARHAPTQVCLRPRFGWIFFVTFVSHRDFAHQTPELARWMLTSPLSKLDRKNPFTSSNSPYFLSIHPTPFIILFRRTRNM